MITQAQFEKFCDFLKVSVSYKVSLTIALGVIQQYCKGAVELGNCTDEEIVSFAEAKSYSEYKNNVIAILYTYYKNHPDKDPKEIFKYCFSISE